MMQASVRAGPVCVFENPLWGRLMTIRATALHPRKGMGGGEEGS